MTAAAASADGWQIATPVTDKVPQVTPWKQPNFLPGGINLWGRPLAADDRSGSGFSAAYRGSADI
jgi:hypothetical protein